MSQMLSIYNVSFYVSVDMFLDATAESLEIQLGVMVPPALYGVHDTRQRALMSTHSCSFEHR